MFVVFFILLLNSCMFLTPYDPPALDRLSLINSIYSRTNCSSKNNWSELDYQLEILSTHISWKNDKFADEILEMRTSLRKANLSKSKDFCESLLKLQGDRIQKIGTFWGKR